MARRKRVRTCDECRYLPVRRGGRRWCAPCYADMKRPKRTCVNCDGVFAADQMNGRRCYGCVSKANHAKRVELVYSITPDDYKRILVFQRGVCAICQRFPRSKRLSVDHDHSCCSGPVSCGQCVRGLLCKACNRDCLGHLRDSTQALQRAIDYLNDWPARQALA